jgi:hypothetical protein
LYVICVNDSFDIYDQKSEVLIESLQSVGDENMDEEEEVKTMSSSDDTFNMSAKQLRKLKKKERKVARRAMLKVTPNVNISRSSHHQHFAKTRLIPHFSDHQMFSYHL